ncbi:MAG: RsmB/NOP family class I SAM-dependent RNA methyltransferase [Candidatus Moraniibacteriota bacterium]|nr:MAG: RsmB/NOP family class I SAM-dependent RNA methyltransferase [Candidatus Moranbacteria bacterium]
MIYTMEKCWEQLPAQFIERVGRIVPQDLKDQILESYCHKRPTTLRVNTLKSDRDIVADTLTKMGLKYESPVWYPDAFVLAGDPFETLGMIMGSEMYKKGEIYVQNLSSMIPPLVLDPHPGSRILDIAAAPGSKTTQMAMMMNDTGEIIANDLSPIRIFKLKANLQGQGVTHTTTNRMPGQFLWKRFPQYFDKSLVDAPCSLEGTIYTERPKSYGMWSVHKIKELSQRQRYLLRSAISATKAGGEIVYSTCTLAPEENEGVIDWILNKENVEIVPINIAGLKAYPGIPQWGNAKPYDPRVSLCMRIYPTELMEGFFVTKLRKIC